MDAMEVVRTPDERFGALPGFPYSPRYADLGTVRMAYVDEGPRDAPPILLLHGEPTWGYLYRKMIPVLVAAGYRCVAPDLIGFGRSDKPLAREAHTYAGHVAWLAAFAESIDLHDATLFGQDWGGLLGLRLVAEHEARFARVVAANTGLPTGAEALPPAFFAWKKLSQELPTLPVGRIVRSGCVADLPEAVIAAYDAPFPDESFKAGPRQMPTLVPVTPDDPAADANRRAWDVLRRFQKPFLTLFSDSDPITRGADKRFQEAVPGAAGQPHTTIRGAGHFLQEDAGEEVARRLVAFLSR